MNDLPNHDEELDRIISVPWNLYKYDHGRIAMKRWLEAGIRWEVYSTGCGSDEFIFETVADRIKAEEMIGDLFDVSDQSPFYEKKDKSVA
jgi:hypothetical protein